jgi:hypothetical protein
MVYCALFRILSKHGNRTPAESETRGTTMDVWVAFSIRAPARAMTSTLVLTSIVLPDLRSVRRHNTHTAVGLG